MNKISQISDNVLGLRLIKGWSLAGAVESAVTYTGDLFGENFL